MLPLPVMLAIAFLFAPTLFALLLAAGRLEVHLLAEPDRRVPEGAGGEPGSAA